MPEQETVARRRFLKMAGGGGVASAALVLAACGSDNKNATTSAAVAGSRLHHRDDGRDLEIVNYALTLEYLEAEFYKQAAATGFFKGASAGPDQDDRRARAAARQRADAAVKQLGGTPATKPTTKFPTCRMRRRSLKTAQRRREPRRGRVPRAGAEDQEQGRSSPRRLSIHSVEAPPRRGAEHRSSARTIDPDGAFAKPASMDEVLPIKPFIQQFIAER